jgi:hypothetical protein
MAAKEFERRRYERAKLRSECDVPNSARVLRCRNEVKYGFIASHCNVWPVRAMCRVLDASAAGLSLVAKSMVHRVLGVHNLHAGGEICLMSRLAELMQAAGIKTSNK